MRFKIDMVVNINDIVEVTLTNAGKRAYEEYFNGLYRDNHSRPTTAAPDVLKTELWGLFQIFGSHMSLGMPSPMFKHNNIQIQMCKYSD
jgi:hypothetical protein